MLKLFYIKKEDIIMSVFNNLISLRKKFNYSQQEIADKLGITRQTYIKMEKNENEPDINQINELANIYGIPVEEFFYGIQNIEKFKQMYLYILSKFKNNGLPKTKLAKLLYFADFRHFYNTLEPMSGVLYRHKDYGPLADPFLELTEDLAYKGKIQIECLSGGANMITIKTSTFNNTFDLLSKEELKEIDDICEKWRNIDTKQIVSYTHQQKPWMACRDGEIIPYELILQEDPDHVDTPIT